MCRSIKTLREPYTANVTEEDVRAAALQYVRKVSGFRRPARHNAEAFDRAVDAVAGATLALLDQLELRTAAPSQAGSAGGLAAPGVPMGTASSGLIGRDGPLAALDAALAGAGSGRPSAVLVGGEAGVGKSRLVSAFAERSSAAGGAGADR